MGENNPLKRKDGMGDQKNMQKIRIYKQSSNSSNSQGIPLLLKWRCGIRINSLREVVCERGIENIHSSKAQAISTISRKQHAYNGEGRVHLGKKKESTT